MKFINLLKKELAELINRQMVIGLAITFVILMLVGQVMNQAIDTVEKTTLSINLCDMDDTEFTNDIINDIKQKVNDSGGKIKLVDKSDFTDMESSEVLEKNDIAGLVVIPEGFTEKILANDGTAQIESISSMHSSSALGSISSDTSGGVALIQDCIMDQIMESKGMAFEEIQAVKNPFELKETTIVNDKSASISMSSIINSMTTKNMIIPIIIFILVIYTSQMIIGAISTEKIDKTLETLLSAPVSRTSVLGAKMLAAAIVALLNAVVYMFGFTYFIAGATSSLSDGTVSGMVGEVVSTETAMSQLGLTLSVSDYVLIGVQMFLTIMISLSVSIILGAMANDAKSAQSMIMPIMLCAMIPYMISMVADVNSLSPVIRIIVYAIPFTHTFTAMSNLMFGNDTLFIAGIIYQAILFCICMFFALKLFNSDKIFTASLNFGQKNKMKQNANNE